MTTNKAQLLVDDKKLVGDDILLWAPMVPVASRTLRTFQKYKELEEKLNTDKAFLREQALGRKVSIVIENTGTVQIKTPPESKPTKSWVVNGDALGALPISIKKMLIKKGVIRVEKKPARISTASVDIRPV